MRIIHGIFGGLASISLLIILLITSVEIGAYSNYVWYEKEYEKYNVLEELEMEMPDVMEVTKEMMAYLRGGREDLNVNTVVDGREREFFNEKEKTHMVDVKNLFVGGLWFRRGAFFVLLFAIVLLVLTKGNWKRLLPKSFLIGLGVLVGITIGCGVLFLSDFDKYFTLFHELFFTNDLWLLDPTTDLLIRMLPEGFFLDMVVRIGITFLILMFAFVNISIIILLVQKVRQKNMKKNVRMEQNVL